MLPTSMRPGEILRDIYSRLYTEETGFVVSTGYGRELLKEADAKITEITCHGAGASYLAPGCDTVIDIGGQDCKVITLDSHGQVNDFLMNDKCAAGTGRFMEMIMARVGSGISHLDDFVQDCRPYPSTACALFLQKARSSWADGPGDASRRHCTWMRPLHLPQDRHLCTASDRGPSPYLLLRRPGAVRDYAIRTGRIYEHLPHNHSPSLSVYRSHRRRGAGIRETKEKEPKLIWS